MISVLFSAIRPISWCIVVIGTDEISENITLSNPVTAHFSGTEILLLFKNFIAANNLSSIKNLVIRAIENQILVGIVTTKHLDLKEFLKCLTANFNQIGLYEIINKRKDSVVLSGEVVHIGGIKEIEISTNNIKYSVDLMGFHQTNLEIQNKLPYINNGEEIKLEYR